MRPKKIVKPRLKLLSDEETQALEVMGMTGCELCAFYHKRDCYHVRNSILGITNSTKRTCMEMDPREGKEFLTRYWIIGRKA